MRVLVFGDSIAYGRFDSQGGWVTRLRRYYDERSGGDRDSLEPTIYNQSISGDTAEDILNRFDIETKARQDDLNAIVLAVGTNDSATINGRARYEENKFRANINELITKSKNYVDKILIVGLLPVDEKLTTPIPWRPDRHYTNERIRIFDSILENLANTQKVSFYPLYSHFDSQFNLFQDGLHPNDEGHKMIFELVRPELDKLIK